MIFSSFLGGAVNCFGGIIHSMTKSIISKMIFTQEIAKVFSLMTMINFIFGLVSSPLFNMVYKSTLDKDPAVYNFVGAGLCMANIFVTMWVICISNSIVFSQRSEPFYHKYLKVNEQKK